MQPRNRFKPDPFGAENEARGPIFRDPQARE
jgi:hypothetical protein